MNMTYEYDETFIKSGKTQVCFSLGLATQYREH